MIRRCGTCAKLDRDGRKCKVLTEMIGKKEDCWAWTDDPGWEIQCEIATRQYKRMKEARCYA